MLSDDFNRAEMGVQKVSVLSVTVSFWARYEDLEWEAQSYVVLIFSVKSVPVGVVEVGEVKALVHCTSPSTST